MNLFNHLAKIKMIVLSILFVVLIFAIFAHIPVHAYSSNTTPSIAINTTRKDNTLYLTYDIVQAFNEDSHGIYLSLPNNQGGVWTKYSLTSVKTSKKLANIRELDCSGIVLRKAPTCDIIDGSKIDVSTQTLKDAQYEIIKEWNQLRVRVGDPSSFLAHGYYAYRITVEASINPDDHYKFNLLNDWTDPVGHISVISNGQDICKNQSCTAALTTLELNPDKPKLTIFHFFVSATWPYLIILGFAYAIITLLWLVFGKDKKMGAKSTTPKFEPPKILPWEANFILNNGGTNLKKTLLSYLLWLNHEKYIKIKPVDKDVPIGKKVINMVQYNLKASDKITVEIVKELPNYLPAIFNITVERIAEKGLQAGMISSRITPASHQSAMNSRILSSVQHYYKTKPIPEALTRTFLYSILGFFALLITYLAFLKNQFLLGESYGWLIMLSFVLTIPGVYFLTTYWGQLTNEGLAMKQEIAGYRYYLKKAEQFKLDFSNNPKDGVQYYLAAVPFAAAFGILPTFQKHMNALLPHDQEDVNLTNSFTAGFFVSTFYAPPSSGGGFSGGGSSGGFSGGGGSW